LHYAFPGCRLELRLNRLGGIVSKALIQLGIDLASELANAAGALQRSLEQLQERLRNQDGSIRVSQPKPTSEAPLPQAAGTPAGTVKL
jgi:hypothetical protein